MFGRKYAPECRFCLAYKSPRVKKLFTLLILMGDVTENIATIRMYEDTMTKCHLDVSFARTHKERTAASSATCWLIKVVQRARLGTRRPSHPTGRMPLPLPLPTRPDWHSFQHDWHPYASRCRLGDKAALINFLFLGHNDQRQSKS